MIKILHTSDWHIGRSLYDYNRDDEFKQFFEFLTKILIENKVDVLLVCGDIFDTFTPNNSSQKLYYDFLTKLTHIDTLENIVIIGGNHDSPSFLKSTKALLKNFNIDVVNSFSGDPKDEVLTLYNCQGKPKLIIGAVPFLRNNDVRKSNFEENLDERNLNLRTGIQSHYQKVGDLCKIEAEKYSPHLPIIGTGHLAITSTDKITLNQIEHIYIGTLDMLPSEIIPSCFQYTALGHIHKPQDIAKNICYCGSPLQLNFNEANSPKYLNLVEIDDTLRVKKIPVPVFQRLVTIEGDGDYILSKINELILNDEKILVEIRYTGSVPIGSLSETIRNICDKTCVLILSIRDMNTKTRILQAKYDGELLSELTVDEVFDRCLKCNKEITKEQYIEYKNTFKEIIESLKEQGIIQ